MRQVSLKIRANNQVTISLKNTAKRVRKVPLEADRRVRGRTAWVERDGVLYYEFIEDGISYGDYCYDDYQKSPETIRARVLDLIEKNRRLLNCLDRHETKIKRATRISCPLLPKVKRFSGASGQKVREQGAAMEALANGDMKLMRCITLTLPAKHDDAYRAIAAYSGYVMDRIGSTIRRGGKDLGYFYVWELQGRGALHLHIALIAGTQNRAAKYGARIVRCWLDSLQSIQEKSGVDMFWGGKVDDEGARTYTHRRFYQNRNEPIRKSLAGYFSKYASKGSDQRQNDGKTFGYPDVYHPRRIWGSNAIIKAKVKEMAVDIEIEYPTDNLATFALQQLKAILKRYNAKFKTAFSFNVVMEFPDGTSITLAEGATEVHYVDPACFSDISAELHLLLQNDGTSIKRAELERIWESGMEASQSRGMRQLA